MKYFLDMYLVFVYWMKTKEPNVSVKKVMPHLVQMAVLILMSAQMVRTIVPTMQIVSTKMAILIVDVNLGLLEMASIVKEKLLVQI